MIIKRLSGDQGGLEMWHEITSKKLLAKTGRAAAHAVSVRMNTLSRILSSK